jgi:hypothetical protein
MVPGLKVHGRYWAPPRRCGHYARENGYCGHHQPAEQADRRVAEDCEPGAPATDG